MPTTLISMRGIPSSNVLDKVLANDIPKIAIEAPLINNIAYSDQELMLQALGERTKIYRAYYGDPSGALQVGENLLFQAAKNSRNSLAANLVGSIPEEINWLAGGITVANFLKTERDHGGFRSTRISGVVTDLEIIYGQLIDKDTPLNMVRYFLDLFQSPTYRDYIYGEGKLSFLEKASGVPNYYKAFAATPMAKNIRVLHAFNEHLDKASHNMLYAFSNTAQRNTTPTSGAKALVHSAGVSRMGQLSALDVNVFKALTENGIIRENSKVNELGPIDGMETVEILKVAGQSGQSISGKNTAKIGEPLSVTLAAAAKVITLIVGGLSVLDKLISNIRNQDQEFLFDRAIDDLNNQANQPSPDDFIISGGGNIPGTGIALNNNTLLYGGLALLGLVAFKD